MAVGLKWCDFIITIEFQIIYGIHSTTVIIILKNLRALYGRQGKNDEHNCLKKLVYGRKEMFY
jgi:hypothetical protein